MRKTFFGRYALLVLALVFFFLPFSVRGARLALSRMKNNVKDWLPAKFPETAEMDWFWKHFVGERFILASWEGCTEEDDSYKLFLRKIRPLVPPSRQQTAEATAATEAIAERSNDAGSAAEPVETGGDGASAARAEQGLHGIALARPYDFIGDRLGLFWTGDFHVNWGGRDEKWLCGFDDEWYFITPDGKLYAWKGSSTPMIALLGRMWRRVFGGQVDGQLVTTFAPEDGAWYYADPRRMEAQLFRTATSGPLVLQEMTREGGALAGDLREAKSRLEGVMFGADGKQTCLVVTLTPAGLRDFHRVLGRGLLGRPRGRLLTIAEECGIPTEELRLGGPPVDNVAIDEEGTVTLVRLVSYSVVLGMGLAYVCFRTISATIIVFFVGGISALMSVAWVGWMGSTVDAIMMSMPSLVYVLGISGAVHIINYYREAVHEGGLIGAPEQALKHGWKPAVLCAVTTALGLASLYTSEIVPIAKFGVFSAIAVMGTLIILFTYLPAALEIWPQRPRANAPKTADTPWYESLINRFWEHAGAFIIRNHYAVAAGCLLIIIGVGFGITRLNTSIDLLKLFDQNAKILRDYAWLETNLGKLVPMEVVVRYPTSLQLPPADVRRDQQSAAPPDQQYQLSFLDRMELVERIQRSLERTFGKSGQDIAGRSLSAATFAPVMPPAEGDSLNFARRRATDLRLEQHRPDFLKSEYLRLDPEDQAELWRISVRIGALQNVDYGQFVHELKCVVEPVLAAQNTREDVLRAIASRRENGSYAGGSVCLLGASGALLADSPVSAGRDSASSAAVTAVAQAERPATSAPSTPDVDQTSIYTETLRDLLRASRIRLDWHDPESDAMPDNFAEILRQFDCVVLVRNSSKYDQQLLQANAPCLIDGRNHIVARDAPLVNAHTTQDRVAAVYTGVVPIVYKAQRTLLTSLVQSTIWSFATITPVMMLISRSFLAGTVAMLPNLLPIFVIFGGMGWLGISVDIGSMMTASIALGVAVDDTIHYLNWFREELRKTDDRRHAILAAYKHCAVPTFQAATISGLGLSVFALSTFTPTQRFGYLMLSILFAGVVAELVFFPALLAGPLGSVFRTRKRQSPPAADGVVSALSSADMAGGNSDSAKSAIPGPHRPGRRADGPHAHDQRHEQRG